MKRRIYMLDPKKQEASRKAQIEEASKQPLKDFSDTGRVKEIVEGLPALKGSKWRIGRKK